MNSENSKQSTVEGSAFHEALTRVLARHGISLPDLQRLAGLRQQQMYDLKRGDYSPTSMVLRKIVQGLHKVDGVELVELAEVAVAGTGLEEVITDPYFKAVFSSIPLAFAKHDIRVKEDLTSRCVISKRLGEAFVNDQKILDNTVRQIDRYGTEFFYFVPYGSGEPAQVMANVVEHHPQKVDKVQQRTYFVRTPKSLFFARIRIDNIREEDQQIHYSLGPQDAPVLFPVQREERDELVSLIYPVVTRARLARREGVRTLPIEESESKGEKLTFLLDYVT